MQWLLFNWQRLGLKWWTDVPSADHNWGLGDWQCCELKLTMQWIIFWQPWPRLLYHTIIREWLYEIWRGTPCGPLVITWDMKIWRAPLADPIVAARADIMGNGSSSNVHTQSGKSLLTNNKLKSCQTLLHLSLCVLFLRVKFALKDFHFFRF